MSHIAIARVEENAGRWGRNGWSEKRAKLLITGLAAGLGADELLPAAVSAMASGGYGYGASHPTIVGLYLLGDVDLRAKSRTSVEAVVTYKVPDEKDDPTYNYVAFAGDFVLGEEATSVDAAGDPIYTEYSPDNERAFVRQDGEVRVQRIYETLEFSRTSSSNPAVAMRGYPGTVNSAEWQGDAAGTWLCAGARFSSDDGARTFARSMRFAKKESGWEQEIFWRADNGHPPPNVDAAWNEDKAHKWIQVYGELDFNNLNLPEVYTSGGT
jgi:hypothetical protein